MILDQTAGEIQQLSTTAGLNVWTWSGISPVVVPGLFTLAAAQTYLDGALKAQSLVDGAVEGESYLEGAVVEQARPN